MTRTASGSPEWLFLQRFPHCALCSPYPWFLTARVASSVHEISQTPGGTLQQKASSHWSPQFCFPYALGCLWKACSSPEKGEAERYLYGREGEHQSVGSRGRAGQSEGKVRNRVSGKTPKQPHSLVRAGLATCPLSSLLPFSFS